MINQLSSKAKIATLMAVTTSIIASSAYAQTTASMEDVSFDPSYESLGLSLPDTGETQDFTFNSGSVAFTGQKQFWGGLTGFDCSKSTDNTTFDFTNDRSSIVGTGSQGSTHYGIAYLNSDWPDNPSSTIPIGVKLTGEAANSYVISMDISNTTYTYYWIMENLHDISYLKLSIQGYQDGSTVNDPIEYLLANINDEDTFVLNEWHSLDLTALGEIDSFTVKLDSDNDWTPFYFAFDNIVTFDNKCNSNYASVTAESISVTSLLVNHNITFPQAIESIDYVIDQTESLIPEGPVTNTTEFSISIDGLMPNTEYVYHYRTLCINGEASDWDTIQFKTFSTHLADIDTELISVYPNPATEVLFVNGKIDGLSFKIINTLGQIIKSESLNNEINISQLHPGMYRLQIFNQKNDFVQNFNILKQ